MEVQFGVSGSTYPVPERQAAIMAENLRLLARSRLGDSGRTLPPPAPSGEGWDELLALANAIEAALVVEDSTPVELEGGSAAAAYNVLRLMVGMDSRKTAGLRDALGAPIATKEPVPSSRPMLNLERRHLSRAELLELLIILFVLAILTVVASFAWTGFWWVLAPCIAALLGLRVATTRTSGRLAWSVASVVWWTVMLIPAAVIVILTGLLVVSVIQGMK